MKKTGNFDKFMIFDQQPLLITLGIEHNLFSRRLVNLHENVVYQNIQVEASSHLILLHF